MKIALAIHTSAEINEETRFLIDFSNNLEKLFLNKKFGSDIKEIIIGIICVSSQFEPFFKPRKPKYIRGIKSIKSIYTKEVYEIEKCLTYDLKLDFETFKNCSEIEAKKYLSEEILKSLEIIETMKSKIKDFDLINFKKDLENYFKEKGVM